MVDQLLVGYHVVNRFLIGYHVVNWFLIGYHIFNQFLIGLILLMTSDENANVSAIMDDRAHPERQDSTTTVDMNVIESQFREMKEKDDVEKENKIRLKIVGKSVSVYKLVLVEIC